MSEFNEQIGSEAPSGVSRRTVTKAMAWAVPVIAVSAAVPAYAASQGIVRLTGDACKLPGASADLYKGYAFGISISNTTNASVTVNVTDLFLDGTDLGQLLFVNLDNCTLLGVDQFTVAAKTTLANVVVLTQNAANSQQGELTVTYNIEGVPGSSTTVTANAPVTPPVQGAVCDDFTDAEKTCIQSFVA